MEVAEVDLEKAESILELTEGNLEKAESHLEIAEEGLEKVAGHLDITEGSLEKAASHLVLTEGNLEKAAGHLVITEGVLDMAEDSNLTYFVQKTPAAQCQALAANRTSQTRPMFTAIACHFSLLKKEKKKSKKSLPF